METWRAVHGSLQPVFIYLLYCLHIPFGISMMSLTMCIFVCVVLRTHAHIADCKSLVCLHSPMIVFNVILSFTIIPSSMYDHMVHTYRYSNVYRPVCVVMCGNL